MGKAQDKEKQVFQTEMLENACAILTVLAATRGVSPSVQEKVTLAISLIQEALETQADTLAPTKRARRAT